jgi:hypothetical protein
MKLYSILLFQKFQDGQKPKLLKEVHDLKELSFFQKGPFKESAELAGQLLAEKAGTSSLTREKWCEQTTFFIPNFISFVTLISTFTCSQNQ